MGRLKILSGKEVYKILSAIGFEQVRQKGGHIIMKKKISNINVTVTASNHPEIKTGTLQSIIRQSEITKEQFESH